MENKTLQLFDKCVNGKGNCATCPYHNKERPCLSLLGRDIMTYIETLKDQIEYYEEVIEEYEKAELDREDKYKPIELIDVTGTFYRKSDWTIKDGLATTDKWTMELDGTSGGSVYTTTTASSCCCDEGLTLTTSGSYTPVKGVMTTTSASSTDAKEYVLESFKSLHERVVADLEDKRTTTEPVRWHIRE